MKNTKLIVLAACAAVIMITPSCEDDELAGDQFLISIAEKDGGQDFYYNSQKRVVLIDLFSFYSDEKTVVSRIELNYANGKLNQVITKGAQHIIDDVQIEYDEALRISRVESTYEILLFSYLSDEYILVEIHSKEESKIVAVEKWYLDSNNRIIKTESQSVETNSTETVEYLYSSSTNLLDNLKFSSVEYKLIYGSQVFLAQEVIRTVRNQAGDEIYKSHYYYEPDVWKNGFPVGITERVLDETNSLKVADKYTLQWGSLVEE